MKKNNILMILLFLVLIPFTCFAAISTSHVTQIMQGINSSTSTFYILGGSILVVKAGMWGYIQIIRLLKEELHK